MTANELLDAACTSKIGCLNERDLLIVIAQALSDGATADELMAAACESKIACLQNTDLLKVIAQAMAAGGGSGDCIFETTPAGLEGEIGFVTIDGGAPGVTALTANYVHLIEQFTVSNTTDLVSISFPLLEDVSSTGAGQITNNPSLTSISFPLLVDFLGQLQIDGNSVLNAISAPLLSQIGGLTVVGNAITTFSLPSLTLASTIDINSEPNLSSVSLPLLATATSLAISGNPALAGTLSLPSLVTVTTSFSASANALTALSFPVWVPTNGCNIDFTSNALNQASVDMVLAKCVANAGFVSGTVALDGGTNSAPSGAGAANALILTGRGVTVTTN